MGALNSTQIGVFIRSFRLRLLALWLFSAPIVVVHAFPSHCAQALSLLSNPRVRPLSTLKQIRVGTYNTLNLYLSVGKHEATKSQDGYESWVRVGERQVKPERHVLGLAKAIRELDLDVLVLQEVEGLEALENFNKNYLGGRYRTFLQPGNDPRGIQIAFLVKKDLPFIVEFRTYRNETWIDPSYSRSARVPLFTRDLPVMFLRAPQDASTDPPIMALVGNHFKSKRDRPGDPGSAILRAAQIARSAEIVLRLKREFGDSLPLAQLGDFNGSLHEDSAMTPLFSQAGLRDSLDLPNRILREEERVTHTFHPPGEAAHKNQLDAILVDPVLYDFVRDSGVYRYHDRGRDFPIPQSSGERRLNPSDHFPVWMSFDFERLLRFRRRQ